MERNNHKQSACYSGLRMSLAFALKLHYLLNIWQFYVMLYLNMVDVYKN